MTNYEGDSFGENAFLQSKARGATCIAKTITFCAAVHKNYYLKIVKKQILEKL